MPFQNSPNGFNNQNNSNSQGEKKRTNFPVGKLYAKDAIMAITVWKSDSTVYTILSAKQAVGKDPSTNTNVYEQKMPNELPRVFLNPEDLRAFIEAADISPITKGGSGSFTIAPRSGKSSVSVNGNNGQIIITFKSDKGTRTATFDAVTVGDINIPNPSWKNLLDLLKVALNKALYAKLDADEFGTALAATAGGADAVGEELPI